MVGHDDNDYKNNDDDEEDLGGGSVGKRHGVGGMEDCRQEDCNDSGWNVGVDIQGQSCCELTDGHVLQIVGEEVAQVVVLGGWCIDFVLMTMDVDTDDDVNVDCEQQKSVHYQELLTS